MKNLLAAIAATLLFGASLFAEGYISANDIDLGKITSDRKEEDGFIIHGAQKAIEVTKDDVKIKGEKFTQRFKMGGSALEKGGEPVCYISFPAKKGETVTIYGLSSSKTEARVAEIYNTADKSVVKALPMGVYDKENASVVSFKIPADGRYAVGSKHSTIYIYNINVSK